MRNKRGQMCAQAIQEKTHLNTSFYFMYTDKYDGKFQLGFRKLIQTIRI